MSSLLQRPVQSPAPHASVPAREIDAVTQAPANGQAGMAPASATRPVHGWPLAAALVASLVLWLLVWYGDTVASMVAIWVRSETFTHGFIVLPISAWLVWRRRHVIAGLVPQPDWRVLVLLAGAGFAWLLGQLASVGVVQQFALACMIPLLVWATLGGTVARSLAFPLFFLLFAVPFGEFMVPTMMAYTADFTVYALRLSGIPVYREGNFFTIPSGHWSVVEACGGLRYLIASLTLGLLYAYLSYRSPLRRAIFIAASVIVPIIANWMRAYMIVMIGHLSDMKYAIGVDHLIYGWLFFGVVMLALLWVGSYWREDDAGLAPAGTTPAAPLATSSLARVLGAAVAATAVAAFWPLAAAHIDRLDGYRPAVLQAPTAGSWQPLDGQLTTWTPHYINPTAFINQVYAAGTERVGLYLGYYTRQRQEAELITSRNTLASTADPWWRYVSEGRRSVAAAGMDFPAIEARLSGLNTNLLVWRWYWVDGQYTVNAYWAKFLQAKSRLLGRGDDSAVVIVYTELDARRDAAAGRLQQFVDAMLPAITRTLEHAR